MSNVKELADAEAARAEAEQPDEPGVGEPDTSPEGEEEEAAETQEQDGPEPEQPSSEAMAKAAESELRRHEKAWAKIVGSDVEALHVCAMCGGVGFTQEDEPPVKDATFAKACPDCNGYGKVISGALNENTRLIDCRRCTGYGYVTDESDVASAPNGQTEVTITPPRATDPEVEKLRARGFTVIEPLQVTPQ